MLIFLVDLSSPSFRLELREMTIYIYLQIREYCIASNLPLLMFILFS